MDLFISLEKSSSAPMYEQLYEGIKQAILKHQLAPNKKLPSKRQLADYLSISQTTVELAYNQLLAEGYIRSMPRVGYFVENIEELPLIETAKTTVDQAPVEASYKYNFSPSFIDEQAFPMATWRKYAKTVLDDQSAHLLQMGQKQGEYDLRVQITEYLLHSRGIQASPEQIVIGSGTEQILPMIVRLFKENTKIAVENPGYSTVPLAHAKHLIVPISVEEDGLSVEQLEQSEASVVYVTPAHQFPTGSILSASKRSQLLRWALKKPERYIIEDDYDSEFRYVGKPISTLTSLDKNDKVIYISTFTKSLMPSLRVAYFVLPKSLLPLYKKQLGFYSSTVPRFDQHILAQFMKDGHFAKHVNKMRKIYKRKHDLVIQTLQKHYSTVRITGEEAGMHLNIHFRSKFSEQQLIEKAKKAQINIRGISTYYFTPKETDEVSFLLGFGGIPQEEIEQAIHALMTIFLDEDSRHID